MNKSTGAKPALGPNCMISHIYGIIQFGPKTGLAPMNKSIIFELSCNIFNRHPFLIPHMWITRVFIFVLLWSRLPESWSLYLCDAFGDEVGRSGLFLFIFF